MEYLVQTPHSVKKSKIVDVIQELYGSTCLEVDTGFALDISGSTDLPFGGSFEDCPENLGRKKDVLTKELEIVRNCIRKVPLSSKVFLTLFGFEATESKEVRRMPNGMFTLPNAVSGGGTNTAMAIYRFFNEPSVKKIVIVTDGQTGNTKEDLLTAMKHANDREIEIQIIAIFRDRDLNFQTMSSGDVLNLPGMDLVNWTRDIQCISKMEICTPSCSKDFHCILSRNGVNSGVVLFGFTLPKTIPIEASIMTILEKFQASNMDWGNGDIDLKTFMINIGEILAKNWKFFPEDTIVRRILDVVSSDVSRNELLDCIKYGFENIREGILSLRAGFQQIIEERKTTSSRKSQFSDADKLLKTKGLTMGSKTTISVSIEGSVIIDNAGLEKTPYLGYPNSLFSGRCFVGDSDEQACRQACRKMLSRHFPDSQDENTIFAIASVMSRHIIAGELLNSESMKLLQKYAIIQCGKTVVVSGSEHSAPLFQLWTTGNRPRVHFKVDKIHTSFFVNPLLNPFELSEKEWWALMMYCLGLFENQREFYYEMLIENNLSTDEEFITYLRTKLSSKIEKKGDILIFEENPKSIFTFEEFPRNVNVFKFKDHLYSDGITCRVQQYFSEGDEKEYFLRHPCPHCRTQLTSNDFELVSFQNHQLAVSRINDFVIKSSRPVVVVSESKPRVEHVIVRDFSSMAISSSSARVTENDIVIILSGVTGCGKTRAREYIASKMTLPYHIVSYDDKKKILSNFDEIKCSIFRDIERFLSINSSEAKRVFILDMCHETGFDGTCFGFDFSVCRSAIFRPNFYPEDLQGYEAWSISNVLERAPESLLTNYSLTRHGPKGDIGVYEVHEKKSGPFFKTNNVKRTYKQCTTKAEKKKIPMYAERYRNEILSKYNLETEIDNFLVALGL